MWRRWAENRTGGGQGSTCAALLRLVPKRSEFEGVAVLRGEFVKAIQLSVFCSRFIATEERDMSSEISGYSEYDCIVIRTDYSDEGPWRDVKAKLQAPQGDDAYEPSLFIVDDPSWGGASVDAVLAAVASDEFLSVMFLADEITMRAESQALLAVNTENPEEIEFGDSGAGFSVSFRVEPAGVFGVDANLRVANLDFGDYAMRAASEPDGVYRYTA